MADAEKGYCDLSCWNRRTIADKICCIGLITFAVLSFLAFIITITIVLMMPNNCLTEGCFRSASQVLELMDRSVDPCEDFYKFACGSFLKNTIIPEGADSVDLFSELEDELKDELKILVMEKPLKSDPKPYKLANYLYEGCMNEELIEKRGIQPMVDKAESLGGWPVVKGDKWKEGSWDWQKTIKEFRKLGFDFNYIFQFFIEIDKSNRIQRIIHLDQLPNRDEEINYKTYLDYMIDVAKIYGADPDRAKNELKESLEFEKSLRNIAFSRQLFRPSSAGILKITEIQKRYSYVNWLDFINSLLPKGINVNEQERIMIIETKFFDALGPLLEKTPKRVIANYLMWKIHEFSIDYLTKELRNRRNKYENESQQESRMHECIKFIQERLPISIYALFIRKHLPRFEVLDMLNKAKKAFENVVLETSWMDDKTKNLAIHKLAKMSIEFSCPDVFKNVTKLKRNFKDLEIDRNRYFESILKVNIFTTDYSFSKLRQHSDATDWVDEAQRVDEVNGLYVPPFNTLKVALGILNGIFFDYERPQYMNYGALGWVIGHEITHGFDAGGAQYDADGKYVDWWNKETKKVFLEKRKCLGRQYGNFVDKSTGMKINGNLTLNENIADNGGIKVSYLAYKSWVDENGKEQQLSGLNYSQEQMFWISAAQMWCSKDTPEFMKAMITDDEHSPNEFRVLGSLRNMEDFSKDFNCPEGSPMNPVEKCQVCCCDISCWNRRTAADKICCIGLITFAVLSFLTFIITITIVLMMPNNCLTEECIHTASKVLEFIDRSVDPCDDFHKFACGSFLRNAIIPEGITVINPFSILRTEILNELNILVTEKPHKADPKPYKLANDLYKACTNEELIKERGIKPMTVIAKSLGGWPVIEGDKWKEESWEWQKTIIEFRKLGFDFNYILRFDIGHNTRQKLLRIIYLDQLIEINDGSNENYLNYMIDLAVIYGADPNRAKNELKKSFEFEKFLYNISFSSLRSIPAEFLTIKEIQKRYSYVNWLDFINSLLPKGINVNEQETIMVIETKFFDELGPLLEKTPKRVIANYLMWKIHEFAADYLTEELRNRRNEYRNGESDKQQKLQSQECSEFVLKRLSVSVNALFIRKYFPNNTESMIRKMLNNFKNEFEKLLLESSWMDEKTIKSAIQKLKKIRIKLCPKEFKDTAKLEQYFKNLEIDPNRYFESILKLNAFHTNHLFGKLRKPTNERDWTLYNDVTNINGLYVPWTNIIKIYLGILNGKFFNYQRPQYMNYGALGWAIGHEITHGFDRKGGEYDANGKYVNWWDKKTKKMFLEKSECLIWQYGNFVNRITGLKLNGTNKLNENIADNGGIKVSYRAYKSWIKENGKEQRLPGLNYTPEQLFWISAAQLFCSKYTKGKKDFTDDTHSPADFRILGTFRNRKEFAEDFNCPKGSGMNPIKKCEVW